MTIIENYILVENIGLTNPQRGTLVAAIVALGQNYMYPNPVRSDNQAGFYEASFRSGDLLHYSWRTRLGTLFSVDPLSIDVTENNVSYGSGSSVELVFSRLGIDYFRVILFGAQTSGGSIHFGSKEESAAEARAYKEDNAEAWS